MGVAAHDSLTLHVTAGALTRGAGQSITTLRAIFCSVVGRAGSRVTRASLLRIALPGASAADGLSSGKLAIAAAVFVGIVTDGAGGKLAGGRVAACVTGTADFTAAVAVFTFFDDAVAALLTCDKVHVAVAGETGAVNGIAVQCAADVTD